MKKILIVDDDLKLCKLLSRFLKERGYETIVANEGTTAIGLITSENPNLALLDVMMPGDDGFEVLRKIRKFSNLPVIMLTARGETTDRVVGLEMGADDYMPKPFEPAEVDARIRAILRRVSDSKNSENSGNVTNGTNIANKTTIDAFENFTLNHHRRNLQIGKETIVCNDSFVPAFF